MADNVAITAGSGTTIATDDLSGIHYQRVKVAIGADGVAVDLVPGAGAVTTGTPRVTLASDDPAVVALQLIDNAISGAEMQVDVVAALPAGTNNIGDVDVLTVITGTGATNLGKAVDAVAGSTDTGVAALAVRVDTPAAITPAVGDYTPARVNNVGATWVQAVTSATGTASAPALSATSFTALAANTARKGASIRNASASATVYLHESATAATTANTPFVLAPGDVFIGSDLYTGQITAIASAAVGNLAVTENT